MHECLVPMDYCCCIKTAPVHSPSSMILTTQGMEATAVNDKRIKRT